MVNEIKEETRQEVKNEKAYHCRDCGKVLKIDKDEQVIGGKFLAYNVGNEKIFIFKCDDCYAKNPSLTNYQQCEVYSRVVGYLRPVQNWNPAKSAEFKNRKTFKVPR
jgi:hypothetical protein